MIIYLAAARLDATLLCEHISTDVQDNLSTIVLHLLEHLRDNPGFLMDGERKTFMQNSSQNSGDYLEQFIEAFASVVGDEEALDYYYFHLYSMGGLVYVGVSDDPDLTEQKVAFACLEAVQTDLVKTFRAGRIEKAKPLSLNKEFQPTLRTTIHHYNINHVKIGREEKTQALLAQVEHMKNVMGRNIDVIMQNTVKMDTLVNKSDEMMQDAKVFKKKARTRRRKNRNKYYCIIAISVLAVLILFYFMLIGMCGQGLQACRANSWSSNSGANNSNGNSNNNNGNVNGNNNNNNNRL